MSSNVDNRSIFDPTNEFSLVSKVNRDAGGNLPARNAYDLNQTRLEKISKCVETNKAGKNRFQNMTANVADQIETDPVAAVKKPKSCMSTRTKAILAIAAMIACIAVAATGFGALAAAALGTTALVSLLGAKITIALTLAGGLGAYLAKRILNKQTEANQQRREYDAYVTGLYTGMRKKDVARECEKLNNEGIPILDFNILENALRNRNETYGRFNQAEGEDIQNLFDYEEEGRDDVTAKRASAAPAPAPAPAPAAVEDVNIDDLYDPVTTPAATPAVTIVVTPPEASRAPAATPAAPAPAAAAQTPAPAAATAATPAAPAPAQAATPTATAPAAAAPTAAPVA